MNAQNTDKGNQKRSNKQLMKKLNVIEQNRMEKSRWDTNEKSRIIIDVIILI